jgi:MFS family permease
LSVSEAGQTVVFFSIAIAAVRFAGDWLANRFPVHLIMAVPMMLAGIMLFAAVLLGQVAVLMAAYVIFGLAIGNAFPIIISQAGSAAGGDRLRDISIVVGFAYVGLITGPALLGVIAHFAGLDATIITLAGAAMILGCLVMTMPRFVPPPQPDQDGVELVKTDQG